MGVGSINDNFKLTDATELKKGIKNIKVGENVTVITQPSVEDKHIQFDNSNLHYPLAVDTPEESNTVINLANQLKGLNETAITLTVKPEKNRDSQSVDIEVKIGDFTKSYNDVTDAKKPLEMILQDYVVEKSRKNQVTLNNDSFALIKTADDANKVLKVQEPPLNPISIDYKPASVNELATVLGLLKGAIDKSKVGTSRPFKVIETGESITSDDKGNILIPKTLLTAPNASAQAIGKLIEDVNKTVAKVIPTDKTGVSTPTGSSASGKVDHWQKFFLMHGITEETKIKEAQNLVADGLLDDKDLEKLGIKLDKSVDKIIAEFDGNAGISTADIEKFEETLITFSSAVGIKPEEAREIYVKHNGAWEKRSVEDLKKGGLAALGLEGKEHAKGIKAAADKFASLFKGTHKEYFDFLTKTTEFKEYQSNAEVLKNLAQRMATLALVADLSSEAQKAYLTALNITENQDQYIFNNRLPSGKEGDLASLQKWWKGEGGAEEKGGEKVDGHKNSGTSGPNESLSQSEKASIEEGLTTSENKYNEALESKDSVQIIKTGGPYFSSLKKYYEMMLPAVKENKKKQFADGIFAIVIKLIGNDVKVEGMKELIQSMDSAGYIKHDLAITELNKLESRKPTLGSTKVVDKISDLSATDQTPPPPPITQKAESKSEVLTFAALLNDPYSTTAEPLDVINSSDIAAINIGLEKASKPDLSFILACLSKEVSFGSNYLAEVAKSVTDSNLKAKLEAITAKYNSLPGS